MTRLSYARNSVNHKSNREGSIAGIIQLTPSNGLQTPPHFFPPGGGRFLSKLGKRTLGIFHRHQLSSPLPTQPIELNLQASTIRYHDLQHLSPRSNALCSSPSANPRPRSHSYQPIVTNIHHIDNTCPLDLDLYPSILRRC